MIIGKKARRTAVVGIIILSIVIIIITARTTTAWFTSEILSEISKITSGTMNVIVNDKSKNFDLNVKTTHIFPNDYIGLADDNSVVVNIKNNGSIPIFYTGNFTFSKKNKLSYGLFFEELKREIFSPSEEQVMEEVYILHSNVTEKYKLIGEKIDIFDVNGKSVKGGDGVISLNEWCEISNTIAALNKGYCVGVLKPGYYEKWTYKIKFHRDCSYTPHGGKSLQLRYKVNSTQFNQDAVKELIKRNKIINVPKDMSEEDFEKMAYYWVNSIAVEYLEKQK
ncbi:hypothetical protein [Oceanirhabdus sp. W0125-5]|uniref:hypothetical protein n=1 Tax=Oceanirhabdus sp. W0125-5 TaxID=2999116 RepID=UPI0022F2AC49|nr:hypothetical protein [Oceanirhabdus sp. W0125-5]WBW96186.1 hypothetical protein OW730_21205 [Oceanirhabdus sp. W0125-5]